MGMLYFTSIHMKIPFSYSLSVMHYTINFLTDIGVFELVLFFYNPLKDRANTRCIGWSTWNIWFRPDTIYILNGKIELKNVKADVKKNMFDNMPLVIEKITVTYIS